MDFKITHTQSVFFTVVNIANMLLALTALIIFCYYIKSKPDSYKVLPRSLRLYLLTCTIPYSLATCLASICLSIFYFTFSDETVIAMKLSKLILSFFAQQFRGSLLLLIIERMVSTIYLERYTSGTRVFIILTFFSYLLAIIYIFPSGAWIFIESFKNVYFALVYADIAVHIITLIAGQLLRGRNRQMYKLLAYRVTLRQRCQILENIKVLTFIFSQIFIYATVAPIGLIATLIYNLITGRAAPTALFLLTYNLSFILIMIKDLKINSKTKNTKISEIHKQNPTVLSPLGKSLPTAITNDNYFKGLKEQWK